MPLVTILLVLCIVVFEPFYEIKVDAYMTVDGFTSRIRTSSRHVGGSSVNQGDELFLATAVPKLVVFDLDGCLWRPEMYELIHFSGGKGAPFRLSDDDKNVILTVAGEPVQLLKDVREVMRELYVEPQWKNVAVGISSRTDAPHWARELLKMFSVEYDGGEFVLDDIFQDGPIEMKGDSKIQHFHRISRKTNIALEEMVFFDNEYGNCESVASLGVTVGYCPGGVCKGIWKTTLEAYPAKQGQVVRLLS